jgi:hypothetical protein
MAKERSRSTVVNNQKSPERSKAPAETPSFQTEPESQNFAELVKDTAPLTPRKILALQHTVGNQTVMRVISRHKKPTPGNVIARQPASKPIAPFIIQRDYASLSTTQKAQVDARFNVDKDNIYKEKAEEFEIKLGTKLAKEAEPNTVANEMLQKTKRIVDAWAKATGQTGLFGGTKDSVYEKEFAWAGGDAYYGAFEMTAKAIKKVFEDETQPLRKKLKIVYNAVRNGNLSKYLKLAAADMKTDAKQKYVEYKVFKGQQEISDGKGGKTKVDVLEDARIKKGFAKDSGLEDIFNSNSKKKLNKIDQINQAEGVVSGKVVVGKGFSNVLGWKKLTSDANADREGFQNWNKDISGKLTGKKPISQQRTLKIGEVDDLTSSEIRQMMKMQGKSVPFLTKSSKRTFKQNKATEQLPWEQGGEFYKIKPGSKLETDARQIEARLVAGISGSTDLMMHAARRLGMKDKLFEMRLAMLGWMLQNRDHSFYEIMMAADSYGTPFKKVDGQPGLEYEDPDNFKPITIDRLKGLLMEGTRPVFPKDYWGINYKNLLADTWLKDSGLAVRDEAELTELIDAGIPRQYIESLHPSVLLGLKDLKQKVDSTAFKAGSVSGAAVTNKSLITGLEQHQTLVWYRTNVHAGRANMFLAALLTARHGKDLPGLSDDYKMLSATATMLTAQADKMKSAQNVKQLTSPGSLKAVPHVKADTYWQVDNAKSRIKMNSIKMDKVIGSIKKTDQELLKTQILSRLGDIDLETRNLPAAEFLEAFATPTELATALPEAMKLKLLKNTTLAQNLLGLNDKELGAIFKYTTAQYMPQITALNSLSTASYTKEQAEDQRNVNWGTPLGTLQYNLPALQGITSGLEKLPVYTGGDVYRGQDSTGNNGNKRMHERPAKDREEFLAKSSYKVGAVQSFNYPLSSSANLQASYIKKAECDIAFVISGIKSGKEIGLLSNSPEEEEILFPPGSRFVITKTNPNGPDNKVYIYMTEI